MQSLNGIESLRDGPKTLRADTAPSPEPSREIRSYTGYGFLSFRFEDTADSLEQNFNVRPAEKWLKFHDSIGRNLSSKRTNPFFVES